MFVREIMSRDLAAIDAESSIYQASKIYKDRKVGSVLVTNQNGLVGIVTERDFIERGMCQLLDIKKTKIKDIMSTDLKTVDPLDKVDKALEIMKTNKIKKLPVVQRNELVGIVTLSDIAHSRPSVRNFLNENKVIVP